MKTTKWCLAFFILSSIATAYADHTVVSDVVYGHKAGMALTYDVLTPSDNAKGIALLYIFSSGYNSQWIDPHELVRRSTGQKGRFATVLDRGFTLFMVRHGSSPKFNVPEILEDIRSATRHVRLHADDYGIDPDRIGVFGNSAGGHLALMLGVSHTPGDPDAKNPLARVSDEVSAVVAYYPPVDFRGRGGREQAPLNFAESLEESLSPLLQVTPDDPPTLLIHGDKDKSVPIAQSEQMYAALKAEGVPTDFIVMKGAGHAFPGKYGQQAAKALTDWFEKYLVK